MRVFALKTDWMLNEDERYHAEWVEGTEDKVRVFYRGFDGNLRSCIRTMGMDVLVCWMGGDYHSPWDMSA